jgi:DNA-binding NarL/FixJ family response regulator
MFLLARHTKSSSKAIRVLLADDHTLVRAGIRALLERSPKVEVVGEASDGREAMNLVKTRKPDVVLMDISMPGLNGLEAASRIAKESPEIRIIILSMHEDEEYVWRALKMGLAGYMLKTATPIELETALQRVFGGGTHFSGRIPARWIENLPPDRAGSWLNPLERLTSRQREILQMIAEGENTKEIADILRISPKTVEYHRMKLMNSLAVRDVPSLVRFALRAGLIQQEN